MSPATAVELSRVSDNRHRIGQGSSVQPKPSLVAEARFPRQQWADVVRVAAVLMIFLFHSIPDWLRSSDAQANSVERFISEHFAEWGIAAFVILSGFALTVTMAARETGSSAEPGSNRTYSAYSARRLGRVLGPYWLIAVPFSIVGFALGEEAWADLWKLPVWLLGLGVVHPDVYQPISEAWWYVSLALQISLLMPLLLYVRRRWGLVSLTIAMIGVNATCLALVRLIRPEWVHLAQGLVLCRLTEIVLGVAAAELVLAGTRARPEGRGLRGALCCTLLALAAAYPLDLLGSWTGWQAMMVLAVIFALGALVAAPLTSASAKPRWLSWAAAISYCFYLTHAPVSKYLGRGLANLGLSSTWIAIPVILLVCVLVAWVADLLAIRWASPLLTRLFRWLFDREPGESGRRVIS